MIQIIILVVALFSSILPSVCSAFHLVSEETTIINCSLKGEIEKEGPKHRLYYEVDINNNKIIRYKLILIKSGEVLLDNAEYTIIPPMDQYSIMKGVPVIYAIGMPGLAAVELLTISGDSIISYKSTGDYSVIFISTIVQRFDTK